MSLIIKRLYIKAFGQFENTSIDLADDFNLIYGKNESGKSTITSFIEGLLYGFDDGNRVRHFNKKQEIYKPMDSYKYAGYGIFIKDERSYRLSRNFFDGTYEIYDLDNSEIIESPPSNLNYPGKFFLNLDYDLYLSLIASYQTQESSSKMKARVKDWLVTGDDYNFSGPLAIDILKDQLGEIGSERAYTKPYAKTIQEIDKIKSILATLADLRETYKTDLLSLDENRAKIKSISAKLKKLKDTSVAYRKNPSFQNMKEQIKYKNELNILNQELEEYQGMNLEEDETDRAIFGKKLMLYGLVGLFFAILAYESQKFYIYILAIILPIVLFLTTNPPKGNKVNKQYNQREDYIRYQGLIKDRDRILEILAVLEDKDKADLDSYMAIKDIDIKDIYAKIDRYEQDLDKLRKINLDLEKSLASTEDRLAREVDLKDKLLSLENNLLDMKKRKKAIDLAIATIEDLGQAKAKTRSNYLAKASEIVATISKGRYEKIDLDENLNPTVFGKDRSKISLDKLSTGFFDQINFALKFAANDNKLACFIIFDDALINYDLDRLRIALFYLLDVAAFRQIIYFTCHKREEEILASESISYNYINLEEL